MPSPLPRRGNWVHRLLASPAVSAFPGMAAGSARASTFSRLVQRSHCYSLHTRSRHQFVARYTEGFNRFVPSAVAPVASGWSILPGGIFTHWESAAFPRRTPGAVTRWRSETSYNRTFQGVRRPISLSAKVWHPPRFSVHANSCVIVLVAGSMASRIEHPLVRSSSRSVVCGTA